MRGRKLISGFKEKRRKIKPWNVDMCVCVCVWCVYVTMYVRVYVCV